MIPLTDDARKLLRLAIDTGGYLLPERGGLWRGMNGGRLAIEGEALSGPLTVATLTKRGCLRKIRPRDLSPTLYARPEWFSLQRPCYAVTELGRENAVKTEEPSDG